jgi:hypothetical protein
LSTNLRELQNAGWSLRFLEWLTIAGILGLIRRAPVYGVMVAAWFASYLLFKGGAKGLQSVDQMSFFRFVMPAYPALVLIAVSIVFLVPGTRRRRRPTPAPTRPTAAALVAVLALAVYPLVLVATATASPSRLTVRYAAANLLVPVVDELRPTSVVVQPDQVRIRWKTVEHGASRVYFRIYRSAGTGCDPPPSSHEPCVMRMEPAGVTYRTRYVDRWPPTGQTTYRIGLVAGWNRNPFDSDLILVGPAFSAKPGRAGAPVEDEG